MPSKRPTKKAGLITAILRMSDTKDKSKAKASLQKKTVAQLNIIYSKAKAASAKKPAKRTSTRKGQTRKTARKAYVGLKAKGKRKSVKKVPGSWKKRAAKVVRAIASGRIKAKGGIKKPSDYKTGDAHTRYKRFLAKYKGVRASTRRGKGKGKAAALGMKATYRGISLKSKKPYFLSKGYRVKSFTVGGGPTGPGTVRKISGGAGKPFKKMTRTQQTAVCNFLNTKQGQQLRGPGAPKKAACSKLVDAKPKSRKTTKRKSTRSRKKASANRWW